MHEPWRAESFIVEEFLCSHDHLLLSSTRLNANNCNICTCGTHVAYMNICMNKLIVNSNLTRVGTLMTFSSGLSTDSRCTRCLATLLSTGVAGVDTGFGEDRHPSV